MEMRTGSLFFQPVRGSGPLTATQTINFPREVQRAVAGMVGYSAGFSSDDHHFGLLDLRLDTQIDSDVVVVTGTFGLRDWSGNWDDRYEGQVFFAVVGE